MKIWNKLYDFYLKYLLQNNVKNGITMKEELRYLKELRKKLLKTLLYWRMPTVECTELPKVAFKSLKITTWAEDMEHGFSKWRYRIFVVQ